MSVSVVAGGAVTPAIARTFIDTARAKDYERGVIGVRARPEATSPTTFSDDGESVRIVPAASALAVREAIRDSEDAQWLLVVTDRSDEDLGAGLLAKFIGQRMRHPDPWDAVKHRFAAHSIDPLLVKLTDAREVAAGLLELTPEHGWPAAPAGVLTRSHALAAAAREHLGLPSGPVDLISVLHWSADPGLPAVIARLRSRAGEAVVDALLGWVADSAGEARTFVAALLRRGAVTNLIPLGVALDCLLNANPQHEAAVALARLQHHWGEAPRSSLEAAGRLAGIVASGMLGGRNTAAEAQRMLAIADEFITEAGAEDLAVGSRLLRSGLRHRLLRLATALERVPNGDAEALEKSWAAVAEHELSDIDARVVPARAAVRLARWLATSDADGTGAEGSLRELTDRHLDVDSWVDSAVNDAEAGVDEVALARAIEHVIRLVEKRRDAHDVEFATALAREGCGEQVPGILTLERVLPEVVAPLARDHRLLLLVLDGMSAGVANEILQHVATELEFAMVEHLLPGAQNRTAALAVLPSVTEYSRASLLAGHLTSGQQASEVKTFTQFMDSSGLGETKLIHKKGLDTTRPGFAVSDEVRQAMEDGRYSVVGCVLNTIDDALDRTDPGGTDWTADTVKHLAPLLRAARATSRLVVITSDHGHVVERRRGVQRGTGLGGRYRGQETSAQADEVLVSGARVLTPEQRAVLAVNERLRYGPLKAGYHGGAAPAEVVVPVAVLAPVGMEHKLRPAPVAEPLWWDLTSAPASVEAVEAAPVAEVDVPQPDLFSAVETPVRSGGFGEALLTNDVYKRQRKLAGRVAVSDDAFVALVGALAGAPDNRLSATRVATLLNVPVNRVPMIMSQISKVLNVEGYPVVSSDPATQAVTLDVGLLAEQYALTT